MAKEKSVVTKTSSMASSQDMRFNADQLFQSRRFKNKYQIDFAKQVLGNKTYIVKEAEDILNKFFNKK